MKLLPYLLQVLILLGGQLVATPVTAEVLRVAVAPETHRYFPNTMTRVYKALRSTGYTIEVMELPRKRSLAMLMQGDLSLELGITPSAIPADSGLIRIDPPIINLNFKLTTSKKTPEICNLDKEGLKALSFAASLGAPVYENFFPQFFSSTELVRGYTRMFQMVALQRAQVTYMALEGATEIPQEIKSQLLVCESHPISLTAHSYLHEDFLWAKDKIEAAYRREFGEN